MERAHAPPAGTDVCGLAEIPAGGAVVITFGRGGNAFELIVVRDRNGVRGFVNVCPHNPLPLNIDARIYSENEYLHCDHHYAIFRFADGMCTAGACVGQALAAVPLAVDGDRIAISSQTASA